MPVKVPVVKLVSANGDTSEVRDVLGGGHDFLNTILGASSASQALYAHLGHGRWVNFFVKAAKDALVPLEASPLTSDEEDAADAAIARLKEGSGS